MNLRKRPEREKKDERTKQEKKAAYQKEYYARKKQDPEGWKRYLRWSVWSSDDQELGHNPTLQLWAWFQTM